MHKPRMPRAFVRNKVLAMICILQTCGDLIDLTVPYQNIHATHSQDVYELEIDMQANVSAAPCARTPCRRFKWRLTRSIQNDAAHRPYVALAVCESPAL